ncbi:MAG: DUF1667 domain-containing protein [Bacilli bacterium]|jgi:CxxC motif-containing protein|nr:DUF1667 domain-containing protein [Bacilli bacterium]NLB40360.1 DUF1667 domain-containing protein [Erysipelotrichaceae bacterium]HNY74540.1 DUF1667 domain-containing protein [Bacilli bacterium]HOF53824.1 DUF1667 domain-containing protein [Bacilli bacterium]HOR20713.1 DUF1667 domain-containing protein [Bacilli bacterium]
MKELICILCPRGCRLKVDDDLNVTGNFCPRGILYAKTEMTNPTRIITSTVKIKAKNAVRLSVKTAQAIPKGKMFDCMRELDKVMVEAPIRIGDVIVYNICETGVDVVATKDIEE